jgi:hypothetical protein
MDRKMEDLHIDLPKSTFSQAGVGKSKSKAVVAESWEDEEDGAQTPTESMLKPVGSDGPGTHPPPPTPISATAGGLYDWSPASALGGGRPQPLGSGRSTPHTDSDSDRRRPEKSTAAAGRMIAASLGVKAPKKTEEQRQYDRAMREQEAKRQNREKEARARDREEDEKAKAAVWDS